MVPISEFIKAIDIALRLRKSIKNASGEFQCLSDRLDLSSKTLSQVERFKANLTGGTNCEEIQLDEACNRYQNTLRELKSHLENYDTCGGSMRKNVGWALKELHTQASQNYQTQITNHQSDIIFLLSFFSAVQNRMTPSVASERVGASQGNNPADPPTPASPLRLHAPQVPSGSSPPESVRSCQSIGPPISHPVSPRPPFDHFGNDEHRPGDFLDPHPQDSRLGGTLEHRSGARGSMESSISPQTPISSGAENCSRPGTPQSSITPTPSIISTEVSLQSPRSLSPGTSDGTRRASYPESFASIDTVPLPGTTKFWYKGRSGLQGIAVSKIAVERGNHGNIRILLIENPPGGYIHHTLSGKFSQSPFMEHRRQFKEVQQIDPTVRYVVSFSGSQKVSKCNNVGTSERVISSGAFEYSFVDEGDCFKFQSEVVGKSLLSNVEVEKIKSGRSNTEGRWATLQLWEDQTITFFSNKAKTPMKFNTANLSIKPNKRKPNEPERLDLEFWRNREGLEGELRYLEIEFTEPGVDQNESKQAQTEPISKTKHCSDGQTKTFRRTTKDPTTLFSTSFPEQKQRERERESAMSEGGKKTAYGKPASDTSFRKTWDKEEYTAKAATREALERQEAKARYEAKAQGKVYHKAVPSDAATTQTTARASRLNISSQIGKTQLVPATASTGKRGRGAGFYCEDCDLTFKDNLQWVDHLNSKQHLVATGQSGVVERVGVQAVRERLDMLRRRKVELEVGVREGLRERLERRRGEEEREREEKRERRREKRRKKGRKEEEVAEEHDLEFATTDV